MNHAQLIYHHSHRPMHIHNNNFTQVNKFSHLINPPDCQNSSTHKQSTHPSFTSTLIQPASQRSQFHFFLQLLSDAWCQSGAKKVIGEHEYLYTCEHKYMHMAKDILTNSRDKFFTTNVITSLDRQHKREDIPITWTNTKGSNRLDKWPRTRKTIADKSLPSGTTYEDDDDDYWKVQWLISL